jgi:hypothetical protein
MCPSALAASSSSQVFGILARVLLRSVPESSTRLLLLILTWSASAKQAIGCMRMAMASWCLPMS